ncbi:hypothetical protein ACU5JM_19645 [Rhodococcus erythropolis]|uniref:hypothetical protein n=1 Tax=Rhodococcus erythropolis TaxID=1833 RepID=UPI00406BB004
MTEYTKGALSIPSLILIIGAVALVVVAFVLLVGYVFSSITWLGPKRMFGKEDNFRLRYFTNRLGMATQVLTSNSAFRLFWLGGIGVYVTRTNRGGFHHETDEQSRLQHELQCAVRDDYRKWLEQFDEQGNPVKPSEEKG